MNDELIPTVTEEEVDAAVDCLEGGVCPIDGSVALVDGDYDDLGWHDYFVCAGPQQHVYPIQLADTIIDRDHVADQLCEAKAKRG